MGEILGRIRGGKKVKKDTRSCRGRKGKIILRKKGGWV